MLEWIILNSSGPGLLCVRALLGIMFNNSLTVVYALLGLTGNRHADRGFIYMAAKG
jgi:hypothetical protein